MAELYLLGLGVYGLATDTTTTLLVIGGIAALLLIAGLAGGQNNNTSSSSERPRIRIDHPHYIDEDDYECTVCGSRFSDDLMTCPHCGVRFTGREEDYEEYDDEEDEWDSWDEEEGL